MATRIYTNSSGSVGVTPSTWNFANQINPVTVPGTTVQNTGSALTSKTEATGTTSPTARAMGRTIIGPLAAQTISGTVKGQMRGQESNTGANATLALAIKIVQPNGTDRAVLLAQTASDSATAGNELATSLTNAQFKNAAESASITLTSQSATAGDYLVIEWGFRSATTTSRNITLRYGNASATDLAENTSETTDNNPWWEFSANIAFQTIVEADGASTISTDTSGVGAARGTGAGASSPSVTAAGEGQAVTSSTTIEADGASAMAVAASGLSANRAGVVGSSSISTVPTGTGAAFYLSTGSSSTALSATASSALLALANGSTSIAILTAGVSSFAYAATGESSLTTAAAGIAAHTAASTAASTASLTVAGNSGAVSGASGGTTITVAVNGQIEDTSFGVTASASIGTLVLGESGYGLSATGNIQIGVTASAVKAPVIAGFTRTGAGEPLANCAVKLFDTATDLLVDETISSAEGYYEFSDPGAGPFYAVAYLPGSPDLAGTTINTLVPA